jgi:hypothetical protein
MENLREMPYLKIAELQTAIYALCELYCKNKGCNSHALEVAKILAFTDNLKQHLQYCLEILG